MVKKYSIDVALTLISVFTPIGPMLATVVVLVLTDLISGIIAAKKRGEKITSNGLSRTVIKFLVYEAVIMIAFLAETYMLGGFIPVCKIVAALVACVEMKSLLENSQYILGQDIFTVLINKLNKADDQKDQSCPPSSSPPKE